MKFEKNVIGTRLESCSLSPLTGFNRNGTCQSVRNDIGVHGVCSQVTDKFLKFTKDRGNDLSTPNALHGFPGLKSGDRWCLCASRWKEAFDNGVAPPVVLSATSEAVLKYINLDDILSHAVDVEH
ncbi:MAG: DUF2237 domain-containing protein [Desulfobacterales bacterium]|jgi:hypothetical protein